MPTVATPDYALVIAAPAALGAAVEASMALGYGPLGVPYEVGGSLAQVMFKGAVASFIAEYLITTETPGTLGTGSFEIAGDRTQDFNAGYKFTVTRSTSNDGIYSVKDGGSTFAAGFTTILVNETVVASAVNGFVEAYAPSVGP